MIFLALIYLSFISLGLPDALLGSAWPMMSGDFGVPAGNAGLVSMVISGGTIVSSLFSHRLISRFGTGRLTLVSVFMTAAALLGFSFSPSFFWLPVLAIPLGLGAGAIDSGLNEFVAERYEAKHMNWLHCFWGVGAMLGPVLVSALTQGGKSWRSGYFSISIIQFALVFLLLFSLSYWKKYEAPSIKTTEKPEKPKEKQGLFAPLRANGAVFAMLIFFLYITIEATMMLWGASYLVQVKDIPPAPAAGWVSLFFVGITGGRFLSGFLSMRLNNEALIRLGSIFVISGLFLLLFPLPATAAIAAYLIIGLGLAPIFPSMLHQTPVYFAEENAQAAMGLQMAFAYTATTLVPPLLGWIFARTSFSLMPSVLLICGLALFFCVTRLTAAGKKTALPSPNAACEQAEEG